MSLFSESSTSPEEVPSRLMLIALISALAGLLVAGIAFPVVGGLGLLARTAGDSFQSLPSELKVPPLPQRSRILASDGKTVLATIYLNENRIVVPLSDIPKHTQKALLAIEDARFYEHGGVDLKGVTRAALRDASVGGAAQGASTITQQYVKNVLIEKATTKAGKKAAQADTLSRKLREARYAIALEKKLTKNQILERYFNIAYFGEGVYGIGTAALHYYGKSVKQLDLQQSAMLTGMVQNPAAYDPNDHPQAARARRDVVLDRMRALGFASEADVARAEAAPLDLHVTQVDNGCGGSFAAYFCQWLLSEAQDDPAFGATQQERTARLFQGGLDIVTSLDLKTQYAAQHALDHAIPPTDPSGVATAAVIIQPGTGQVLAMAQDRRFGAEQSPGFTKVNYATGGITGFQAGSTFKAFVLSEALKKGLPLSTTYYAPSCYHSPVLDNPKSGCFSNAGDSESGTFNMASGTWDSVNTYYVQLEARVGVLDAAHLATAMGITGLPFKGPGRITKRAGSFTLGAYETSPLDMADAYATLAAHGLHCAPMPIVKVLDSKGHVVAKPKPKCNQVLDPGVADTATSVLEGVITQGTGKGLAIGRPVAGKTGTTQNFGAAWFVGYTPGLATAVWVGNPKGAANALINVTINGTLYPRIYGATLAGPIWKQIMTDAVRGEPVQKFAPPDPDVVNGTKNKVPDVTGQSLDAAKAALTSAGYSSRVGNQTDSLVPAGQVAETTPGAGQPAPLDTVVVLHPSTGQAPVLPPPPPVETQLPVPTDTTVPTGTTDTAVPTATATPAAPPTLPPPLSPEVQPSPPAPEQTFGVPAAQQAPAAGQRAKGQGGKGHGGGHGNGPAGR